MCPEAAEDRRAGGASLLGAGSGLEMLMEAHPGPHLLTAPRRASLPVGVPRTLGTPVSGSGGVCNWQWVGAWRGGPWEQ